MNSIEQDYLRDRANIEPVKLGYTSPDLSYTVVYVRHTYINNLTVREFKRTIYNDDFLIMK